MSNHRQSAVDHACPKCGYARESPKASCRQCGWYPRPKPRWWHFRPSYPVVGAGIGGSLGWFFGIPSPSNSLEARVSSPFIWAIIGVICGTLIGWVIEALIDAHRESPQPKVNRQLSVKSLLVYTALVAVSLTLWRVDLPPESDAWFINALGFLLLSAVVCGGLGFVAFGRAGLLFGVSFAVILFCGLMSAIAYFAGVH